MPSGSRPGERLEGPHRRDRAGAVRTADPPVLRQGEVAAKTYQRPPEPLVD